MEVHTPSIPLGSDQPVKVEYIPAQPLSGDILESTYMDTKRTLWSRLYSKKRETLCHDLITTTVGVLQADGALPDRPQDHPQIAPAWKRLLKASNLRVNNTDYDLFDLDLRIEGTAECNGTKVILGYELYCYSDSGLWAHKDTKLLTARYEYIFGIQESTLDTESSLIQYTGDDTISRASEDFASSKDVSSVQDKSCTILPALSHAHADVTGSTTTTRNTY
jgi:hypothetical protein